MDRATIADFKSSIFEVISTKSAKSYGSDCSIDFFTNDPRKPSRQTQKVNYGTDGLRYLDNYLPKEIFASNKNILVVRKGQPYPIADLTDPEDAVTENEEIIPTSPQRKLSTKSFGKIFNKNQNNLSESDGSPLKLQSYADFSFCDSPSYNSPAIFHRPQGVIYVPEGFTCRMSRHLVSLFNVNYTELMDQSTDVISKLPSFWSLCDGTDIQSTVLMGAIPVLYKSEAACHWGLKWTTFTQVETDDIDSIEEKVFNGRVTNNNCFARYDVVQSSAYQGTVSLEFTWKKGSKLLQKPEFCSEAVIKASVTSGDVRSPVIGLFKELTILKSFMSAITTGEINWATSKDDTLPLIDQVKELIESMKLGDAENLNRIQGDDSKQSPMDQFKLEERLDYDFTDYLWKIMITCSSYSELTASLNYIFRALSKGEFQPAVHKKNKTMMAQLIRDSFTGRLVIPHMGGIFPLKLVVEMGIEKLRCDYAHAFVSLDLTTLVHLNYFIQTDLELQEKINNLEKLHHSLEMVVMIHLFLGLPYSFISSCVQKMLKYYESKPVNISEVFEFPVPTKQDLLATVKSSLPSLWSLTVQKKVGNLDLTESKVWTLTTSQPFVHLKKEDDDEKDDKRNEEKPKLFVTYREDSISILG
ncbi:hypothetical protein SNE40_017018 [Patella caerulea]|uniref:Protein zwilch n=1 Tax=Patella caerulea TaxID=87958 RepID=A0AAN8J9M7_PATCE